MTTHYHLVVDTELWRVSDGPPEPGSRGLCSVAADWPWSGAEAA